MRRRTVDVIVTADPPPALLDAVAAYAMARWAVFSARETALSGTVAHAELSVLRARADLHRSLDALQGGR